MALAQGQMLRNHSGSTDAGGIFPRFYYTEIQDAEATLKEGRPIFRDQLMVEIIMPADKNSRPHFKVNQDCPADEDEWRTRFPTQYAAFVSTGEAKMPGTPLSEWSLLARTRVRELNALEVHTVEQLAGIPDVKLSALGMGGRELREQAIAYLASAKDSAVAVAQAAEIVTLKEQLEASQRNAADMGGMLERMKARLDALEGRGDEAAEVRRGPGRPRNAA